MQRIPVESSNIHSIGHTDQTLEVEFKSGTVYSYHDVPDAIFEALMASNSKGQYLNAHVKNVYTFTKH